MDLIVESDINSEIIKLIKEKKYPVSRIILHVPDSPFGNGSIFLPKDLPAYSMFKKFVEDAHSAGINIIAGLDTTCQGNLEAHVDHNAAIEKSVFNLRDLGINEFLVSAPNVIGYIKARVPEARVYLSYSQQVTTLNRARIFLDIGSDAIILHPDVIRYQPLLKNMVKLPQKIEGPEGNNTEFILPVNIGCNWGCINWYFHHNMQSHRTMYSPVTPNQESISDVENEYDYTLLDCWRNRLQDKAAILKSGWISPNNLQKYRDMGYHSFLVIGIGLELDILDELLESYTKQRLTTDFKKFLRIPEPYGDYWPDRSAMNALPSLDPDFVSAFENKTPEGLHYPFETQIDDHCERCSEKIEWADRPLKKRLLEIIDEKMRLMEKGAVKMKDTGVA